MVATSRTSKPSENKDIALGIFTLWLSNGGTERVVSYLAQSMAEEYNTHVIVLDEIIDYPVPDYVKLHVLRNGSNPASGIRAFCEIPFLAWRLAKIIKQHNLRAVLAFLPRPNFIAVLSRAFGHSAKVIVNERVSPILYKKSWANNQIYSWLIPLLYNRANLVISNSESIKDDLIEQFGVAKSIEVIPNPVPLEDIDRQLQGVERQKQTSPFTFVNVGRLYPQKNHGLLLRAFADVSDKESKLVIAGRGPTETELRELASELEIGHRVDFVGFQANPFSFVEDANCFVLSSDYEGFPNALVEALACRTAAISTDCKSGPREILAPDTSHRSVVGSEPELAKYGVLTRVNSQRQLTAAMNLMIHDDDLRESYAKRSRKRVEVLDVSTITKRFADAAERVIAS